MWVVLLHTVVLVVCSVLADSPAVAQQRKASEYEIKAAYLYNFLLFVEWPEAREADRDTDEQVASGGTSESAAAGDTITIGIVGDDPFGNDFAKAEGKMVKAKGKRLVVKRFGRFRAGMDLRQCQLLFICRSEKERVQEILDAVKGAPVLTVSDTQRFLEAGGMINLVIVKKKVRWEINRTPVEFAGLRISSQLLRNAVRTVQIAGLPGK